MSSDDKAAEHVTFTNSTPSAVPISGEPVAKVRKLNDKHEPTPRAAMTAEEAAAAKAEFVKMTEDLFKQMEAIWKSKWCGQNTFGGTFDFNGVTWKSYMIGYDGEQVAEVQYRIEVEKQ